MALRQIPTLNPETFEIEWKEVEVPSCPKCASPMIHLINRYAGTLFFGCPQYPNCRANLPLDPNRDHGVESLDLNAILKKAGNKVLPKYTELSERYKQQSIENTILKDQIKTLKESFEALELEVEYLQKCLESPTIEEYEQGEMKDFFAEIDQRADEDISRILQCHQQRQERRKALDSKLKRTFYKNKAPKAKRSYWRKQTEKLDLRTPSKIKSVVKFVFCFAIIVALVLSYFQFMGLVIDQCF